MQNGPVSWLCPGSGQPSPGLFKTRFPLRERTALPEKNVFRCLNAGIRFSMHQPHGQENQRHDTNGDAVPSEYGKTVPLQIGYHPSQPPFHPAVFKAFLPQSRPLRHQPSRQALSRFPAFFPAPFRQRTQQAVLPSFISFTETLQSREFPRNAQEISFPETLFIAGLFCSGDAKRPCVMALSRQRPTFSGIVQNPLPAAGENRLAGEKRFPVLECRNPFFNAPAPWTGEPASRYQWRCGTIRIRKNCAFADRIPSILQPAMRKAS